MAADKMCCIKIACRTLCGANQTKSTLLIFGLLIRLLLNLFILRKKNRAKYL